MELIYDFVRLLLVIAVVSSCLTFFFVANKQTTLPFRIDASNFDVKMFVCVRVVLPPQLPSDAHEKELSWGCVRTDFFFETKSRFVHKIGPSAWSSLSYIIMCYQSEENNPEKNVGYLIGIKHLLQTLVSLVLFSRCCRRLNCCLYEC